MSLNTKEKKIEYIREKKKKKVKIQLVVFWYKSCYLHKFQASLKTVLVREQPFSKTGFSTPDTTASLPACRLCRPPDTQHCGAPSSTLQKRVRPKPRAPAAITWSTAVRFYPARDEEFIIAEHALSQKARVI